MIDHDYIVIKMVTGDDLLCLVVDEDDDKFCILYPVQMVSSIVVVDGGEQAVTAGVSWCKYTDDEVYTIWKSDVIFAKQMNDSSIEYYKKLIDVEAVLSDDNSDDLTTNISTAFH